MRAECALWPRCCTAFDGREDVRRRLTMLLQKNRDPPVGEPLSVSRIARKLLLVAVDRILVDLFLAADIDRLLVVGFLRAGRGKI